MFALSTALSASDFRDFLELGEVPHPVIKGPFDDNQILEHKSRYDGTYVSVVEYNCFCHNEAAKNTKDSILGSNSTRHNDDIWLYFELLPVKKFIYKLGPCMD